MKNTTDAHRSRWGYHPCQYGLYEKLRFLHKHYWKTVYDFHRWHRWARKEPQNRIGPEPRFLEEFVNDSVWFKPITVRGESGYKIYPKTVTDHGVVELYQRARMPQPEPVDPFEDSIVRQIDALYEKVVKALE